MPLTPKELRAAALQALEDVHYKIQPIFIDDAAVEQALEELCGLDPAPSLEAAIDNDEED